MRHLGSIFALIWLTTAPSALFAGLDARADDSASSLFESFRPTENIIDKTTFVFWVNGAADHFVPEESDDPKNVRLRRADAFDVERIEGYARQCRSCNVVILHDQRGGAHWYTRNKPWAVYLRVYSGGEKILERNVDQINAGNPDVIAKLIRFTDSIFPGGDMHLIYRGHGFIPAYLPGNHDGIPPFDYSNPQTPYGMDDFVEGLRRAARPEKLASITLAACRMAYFDLAAKLAPYARYMIASQVDILETLSVGFGYSFVSDAAGLSGGDNTARLIASQLLQPFEDARNAEESMMETPSTLVALEGFPGLELEWNEILKRLAPEELAQAHVQAKVEKVLSERHVLDLRHQGIPEPSIQSQIRFVRLPSLDGQEADTIGLLSALNTSQTDILKSEIQDRIKVFGRPHFSSKSGLSFELPRL